MTDQPPSRNIRGPLRYVLETSSPQVEAGKKFSITIQIINPYDVPVRIYGVSTTLPIEFAPRTDGVLIAFFKRLSLPPVVTNVSVGAVGISLTHYPQTKGGEIGPPEPI